VLRRFVTAAAVTVILVIGGGTLAYALWSISKPLPEVGLSTGSFELEAHWQQEPALTDLFPGDSATGTALLTLDSPATWQYSVDFEVSGALGDHIATVWYPDTDCTGDGRGAGDTNGSALPGDSSTEFCIEFRLDENTPNTMQGQTAQVTVTVTAEQVRS